MSVLRRLLGESTDPVLEAAIARARERAAAPPPAPLYVCRTCGSDATDTRVELRRFMAVGHREVECGRMIVCLDCAPDAFKNFTA